MSAQPPQTNDRPLWAALSVLIAGLAAAPLFGMPTLIQSLVVEIMIFSILAMSLDLLVGYTGLVSFGHAAFFAVAGYGAAALTQLTSEIFVTVPFGLAVAALIAVAIGWLSIRLSGFYFLMITFAFAQMIYVAATRLKSVTGGSDGLIVPSPTMFGHPVLQGREQFYWVTVVVFALSCAVMYGVVRSQFGRTLVGIRERAARMRALGYNVRSYKLAAFVVGAVLAGVAGILNVEFNLYIAPESAHWTQSALALVMVLIGGSAFFVGPIVGATVVLLLQYGLSSYTEYWGLVLGILFIALLTGARQGLSGLAVAGWNRLRRHL
jgi:branched-chain amino acid transport system permease protein